MSPTKAVSKRPTVLYAIRSVKHLLYNLSTVQELVGRGDKVHLQFNRRWSGKATLDDARTQLGPAAKLVTISWAEERQGKLDRYRTFSRRELLSYIRYLRVKGQSVYYLNRWRKYLPSWQRLALKLFPRLNNWLTDSDIQVRLEHQEAEAAPAPNIVAIIRKIKPDVIVASPANMRFSEETEFIKAGQALGIPTVVPVISWDNLTTKGLFHPRPDKLLVWNSEHFQEAIIHHHFKADQLLTAGAVVFDGWFTAHKLTMQRAAFCSSAGLNPELPIITYLGSSKNIAPDETWLISELKDALEKSSDKTIRQTQIIIRPHPSNFTPYEQYKRDGVVVYPPKGSLPSSDAARQLFYTTLAYSVASVGINTSGMIDAIIADKPVIALVTDTYAKTQSESQHFGHLVKEKAIYQIKQVKEAPALIGRLMKKDDALSGSRLAFVKKMIRPRGLNRSAGAFAADEIEALALLKTKSKN